MKIYNILDFGAKPEENYNNASHIQEAIDTCFNEGGGRVLVPEGVFSTGSLILKSNIELMIEDKAMILASKNLDEYMTFEELASKELDLGQTPTWENCEYNGRPKQFFIYAKDANHLKITGKGIIDGSEEIYYGNRLPGFIEGFYYPRIPLLFLEHVIDLEIKDITLQRSGFWTTHLVGCEDVLINQVKILNNLELANCDGIDPDHCKRVKIKNCYIVAADDAIVFKNTESGKKYGACEDIIVEDSTLITTSAGIKFGTESASDFNNFIIKNINIKKASRGISFQLRDEGNIENIRFENIKIQNQRHTPGLWWGTGEPIFISAIPRNSNINVGHIKNLIFKNIHATAENGIVIYGNQHNIDNVTFKNITLHLKNQSEYPKTNLDLRPTLGSGIIEDLTHVVKIKDAKLVTFKGFTLEIDEDFDIKKEAYYHLENAQSIKV